MIIVDVSSPTRKRSDCSRNIAISLTTRFLRLGRESAKGVFMPIRGVRPVGAPRPEWSYTPSSWRTTPNARRTRYGQTCAGRADGFVGFAALCPNTDSSSRTTFATTAARLPGTNSPRLLADADATPPASAGVTFADTDVDLGIGRVF
jgi:hypothetical protein